MRVFLPDLPPFRALQVPGVTPVLYSADALPDASADGLVLFVLPAEQRRELLARPGLRWVLTLSAGIDHVVSDLPHGAALYNANTLHDDAVAQHALALMLAVGRGLPRFQVAQQAQRWERGGSLHTLRGRQVVIWGYGHIGKLLQGMLEPLGAQVTGLSSRSTPAEVDVALASADDLVLLLPRTPATHHILNAGRLKLLKPAAWVYNLGRGELIDPQALHAALQAGQLGGAALDVTEPEPLPADSPLWAQPNVIITPHIASTTDDLIERGAAYTATVLEALVANREAPGRVELGRGY